jgi:hypothetical protein
VRQGVEIDWPFALMAGSYFSHADIDLKYYSGKSQACEVRNSEKKRSPSTWEGRKEIEICVSSCA